MTKLWSRTIDGSPVKIKVRTGCLKLKKDENTEMYMAPTIERA